MANDKYIPRIQVGNEVYKVKDESASDSLFGLGKTNDLGYLASAHEGELLHGNGTVDSNSMISHTDYIEIPPNAVSVAVRTRTTNKAGTTEYGISPDVIVYDEDFNNIFTYGDSNVAEIKTRLIGRQYRDSSGNVLKAPKYIRVNQPSATANRTKYIHFNIANTVNAQTLLPDGQNMNNLLDVGLYVKAGSRSWSNYPEELYSDSFAPIVIVNRSREDVVIQIIYNNNGIFIRYGTKDSWGKWKKFGNEYAGRVVLPDGQDMNQLTTAGKYGKSDGKTWSNYPDGLSNKDAYVPLILVFTNDSYGYEKTIQFIIRRKGEMYYRYGNTPKNGQHSGEYSWDPWTKFGGGAAYENNTVLPNGQDMNQLVTSGVYGKSEQSSWSNYPPKLYSDSYVPLILVYRNTFPGYEKTIQFVIRRKGEIYYRYGNTPSGGTYSWDNWSVIRPELTPLVTQPYLKIMAALEQIKKGWTPTYATMPHIKGSPSSTPGTPSQYDHFSMDQTYHKIPYSGMFPSGGDIYYNRNLATFFSAVLNPASILYRDFTSEEKTRENYTYKGRFQGAAYGAICSSFAGWLNGQKMYLGTSELVKVLEFYDYNGIESVEIGDVLNASNSTTDHIIVVAGKELDKDYHVSGVLLVEQGESKTTLVTPSEFEAYFTPAKGGYRLGRFPNSEIREVKPVRYATDIIADMGNNTYYYMGDDVWMYIPDSNVTTIYYKKEGASQYSSIAKSSPDLHPTTIRGVTVYNVSDLMRTVGKYYFTTNASLNQKCELLRIDTGTITIQNNNVTLSGYSENAKPLYCQIMRLTNGEYDSTVWPAPPGMKATLQTNAKKMITSDNFVIHPVYSSTHLGHYLRVWYETEFGQAFKDSEFIMRS